MITFPIVALLQKQKTNIFFHIYVQAYVFVCTAIDGYLFFNYNVIFLRNENMDKAITLGI